MTKEEEKEYHQKWRRLNPKKRKEYDKKYYLKNKEKILEAGKEWSKNNRDVWKRYYEKNKEKINKQKRENWVKRYGIDIDQKKEMFDSQLGHCFLCNKKLSLDKKGCCIDHDHKTGKVRGILCSSCNCMLGYAHDNPEVLRKGATYVEYHSLTSA